MASGLTRLRAIDKKFSTVVDVGAASGHWSLTAKTLWPDAKFVLIEPLKQRKAELEELEMKFLSFLYVPAAAGREQGSINFCITDDLNGSGVTSENSNGENIVSMPVTSLSVVAKENNLKGPFLIKLDTHGFEIPILEGCKEIINEVDAFIIECYGFDIANNSLLFWEMCNYMDKLGFRLFDIVDVMHRPVDGAFWQCDAFFIRKDESLFSYKNYR
jgi:FkbM family methyltransferase